MKLITVSGAVSGVGKTTVIVRLLRHLSGYGVIKTTVSRMNQQPVVVTDPLVINRAGKDTALFVAAGAKPVIWLQASPDNLPVALAQALSAAQGCKGIILEGNSIRQLVEPDYAIFILGPDLACKPSGKAALTQADLVLVNTRAATSAAVLRDICQYVAAVNPTAQLIVMDIEHVDETAWQKIIKLIEQKGAKQMSVSKAELSKKMQAALVEGRLPCEVAHQLARECGVDLAEIGKLANELKIKISKCQLGCF